MRNAITLVSVMFGALLSGCVGSEGTTSDIGSDGPVVAGPAEVNETSGAIQGLVVDIESLPVEGAILAIVSGAAAQSVTDAAGRFVMNGIAPGSYQLAVAKLGYSSAARSVDVAAGEVTSVTFTIEKIQVHNAYHTTFVEKGYFECSWTGASTGPCFFPIIGTNNSRVPVDPWTNNKRQFDYGVDAGAMSVFNEMDWDRTSAAMGDSMSIFLSYQARTTSHNYCFAASPKPVLLRWDRAADSTDNDEPGECNHDDSSLPDDEPQTIPMEGQILTSRANTGPGNVPTTTQSTIVGVAFQQSFDLYISQFYWEHAPLDFSALADT